MLNGMWGGAMRRALIGAWMAAVVGLGGCGGGADSSGSVGEPPLGTPLPLPAADEDPFYAAPATIPDVPGTILKSRQITYRPLGVALPNPAWQLQYVTRSADGRPRAAVATVIVSLQQSQLGRPVLLSYQHAYDSLGAPCTPSHTATGSLRNLINIAETLEVLPTLLDLGWTLILPDYEGPDHAFGAGLLAGRATLDAVRAALQFEPLQLDTDTPVGLWGYSGGASATSWAAALQPEYAAEIKLVGAAFGGSVVDPLEVVRHNEQTDSFGFMFTMLIGMAREYPALMSMEDLTPRGASLVAAAKDSCVGEPLDGAPADGIRVADYVAAEDPYATPGFQSVGAKVSLLRAAQVPGTYTYVYHEIEDDLVPIDLMDELAAKWCAAGVRLSYHRSSVGGADSGSHTSAHISGALNGKSAAIAYLQSRFDGDAQPLTPYGAERCNGG